NIWIASVIETNEAAAIRTRQACAGLWVEQELVLRFALPHRRDTLQHCVGNVAVAVEAENAPIGHSYLAKVSARNATLYGSYAASFHGASPAGESSAVILA